MTIPSGAVAQQTSRSVLILDQSAPSATFGQHFREGFGSKLKDSVTAPFAIYSETLDLGRFNSPAYQALMYNFLQNKYRDKSIGVIVAFKSGALTFLSRMRPALWPDVPIVFVSFHPVAELGIAVPSNATGIVTSLDFKNVVQAARILVPALQRLVIVGTKLDQQPFRHQYRSQLQRFAGDIEIIDLSGLPLNDVKTRVGSLPDDTALVYTSMYSDDMGNSYVPPEALKAIAAVANRPIVVDTDVDVGLGDAGGLVLSSSEIGQAVGSIVTRILGGTAAADIPVSTVDMVKPVFDWRQLRRWAINESWLPPGSELRFREISLLERYRYGLLGVLLVLILQGALIVFLLTEHRGRRAAEREARRRLLEVAQMDRILTAGTMSASIAHEINQPLTAIRSNTETAQILLSASSPDLEQLKEILSDIHRDEQRAADIIKHMRMLLKRGTLDLQKVDLNAVIEETIHIIEPEAAGRGIVIARDSNPVGPRVQADPVHLQQVILNLAMNAMDAMQESATGKRNLGFRATMSDASQVCVTVSDTGAGIPPDKLNMIFKSFVTTKRHGTGLGLSIARSIVETYGGRIWAENEAGGGTVFRFTLPLAPPSSQ